MKYTTRGAVLVAAAVIAGVSGCGSSDGDDAATSTAQPTAMVRADLAAQVTDLVTEKVGETPDQVVCGGDLPIAAGSLQECALRAGGDWLPVRVTSQGPTGDGEPALSITIGEETIPEPPYAGRN